uniref:Uncharacterized protein n=1 Tax=Rhizophora mucronata TaxID=61149 RepID=A0A2P2NMM3_RHIMU
MMGQKVDYQIPSTFASTQCKPV